MEDIIFEEEDIPYEEEILRNPYSVKCWLRYIEHKKSAPNDVINMLYERALKELPGSYKIWHSYLKLRLVQIKGININSNMYKDLNSTFERSLTFMHKMPRIWLEYLQFLIDQGFVTTTRRAFDRALRSLPITQHQRIWNLYLLFLMKYPDLQETIVRCYRRYLKLMPEDSEDFIDYLKSVDRLDEAAILLVKIINDDKFQSKYGKSKHQLWNQLCDLVSKNPTKVVSLKVEPIVRQGIKKYTDQVGMLWNALADYYVRSQLFERARDIYEEAMLSVMTVRDFTQIFDAYTQFEDQIIRAKMEATNSLGPTEDDDLELEMHLARLEDLMERRPLLLNSVLLRQNPHNVHEWHKRIKLYEGKPKEIVETYTEAVEIVDPKQASGKLYTLWVGFAKFYEDAGQITDARLIFEKGMLADFKNVDELASLVCEYVEMELRHENYTEARKVLQKAVVPVAGIVDFYDSTEPVQNRLYKSLKVWALYADLEETFGTHMSCKSVYDRILDLKIANPQIVMNYATYLEELNYFEEAFKAYEKGIALFKWPNVYEIWNTYLTKFIARYKGDKLERARDLFEQCLEKCPAKFAKPIYLMYAKLEEDFGQARHAMEVYDKATKGVLPEDQYEMYNMYIRRATDLYGLTHTRGIYHKAIEALTDDQAKDMSMRFADLECKLGEIDRARAIYAHCSQMCDPRVAVDFWKTWKDFEIRHGNEDTLREMMRTKRSVMAIFNTQVNFMSAQMLSAHAAKRAHEAESAVDDSMRSLEKKARELAEESKKDEVASSANMAGLSKFVRGQATDDELGQLAETKNPDEIDIDDDNEDEEDITEEFELEKQTIPSEVFGKLLPEND
ncbi:hypothetical protein HELRODRAFT_100710 [Helobdella robusta]|uniref:Uncharacterized protein n=1 Tax=Helobdella robusta TaxID=6412 RepID=T1ED14_HELRO|nr:hypothetical protein HELRODRAFT_100710 [Helobdella robusta]ESO01455.1 hypothetical protein HELRODRAFT_100710 [Helobdella robusta]